MPLLWQARRGAPTATLDQCISSGHDLGSASHVHKVLLKTFSGATAEVGGVIWSWKGITVSAKPEPTARPRYVELSVELPSSIDQSQAIVMLSPRLRRLGEDRAWLVFDIANRQPLLLAPPKHAPRRKKGLVSLMIDPENLLLKIEAHGASQWLVLGGLESIAAMDKFLSEVPPPEFMVGMNGAFGWSNLEIRTPEGIRFYPVWFRGTAAQPLHSWYAKRAETAGLILGLLAGEELSTLAPMQREFHLDDCHLISHGIHESSVAKRH